MKTQMKFVVILSLMAPFMAIAQDQGKLSCNARSSASIFESTNPTKVAYSDVVTKKIDPVKKAPVKNLKGVR